VRIGNGSLDVSEKTGPAVNVARIHLGIVLVLLLIYFLQAATPLRLHHDTVTLLSEGATVARGGGFLLHGQPTVYPPGYPALVAFLVYFHLAHPWVLIAINMTFLAIGLAAVRRILATKSAGDWPVFFACALSLLSFVLIEFTAMALTDTVYLGVSMMCLLAIKNGASPSLDWRKAVIVAVLLLASICVRRVGVALIPALLYMLLVQPDLRLRLRRLSTRIKVGAIVIAATVSTALAWVIWSTSTLRDFHRDLRGYTVVGAARGIFGFRLKELGEMTLNLPFHVFPAVVQYAIPWLGAIVLLLTFGGIAARRREFSVVEVYFVSYVATLLVWTGYDPRYWLPVMPLLIWYCGLSLRRIVQHRIAGRFLKGYLVLFVATGLLVLIQNTALSFSGSRFTSEYPEFHATYCAAWHCNEGFDPAKVDQDALQVLRDYR
jgi:hypothetical protein